jgi:hypothetical protein
MKEYEEYKKKWKYGKFDVEAYACVCGTDFREYKLDGQRSFTLKKDKKDGRWRKP